MMMMMMMMNIRRLCETEKSHRLLVRSVLVSQGPLSTLALRCVSVPIYHYLFILFIIKSYTSYTHNESNFIVTSIGLVDSSHCRG